MELTVLGYYGGYPYAGVGTSSYLLTSGDYHLLRERRTLGTRKRT